MPAFTDLRPMIDSIPDDLDSEGLSTYYPVADLPCLWVLRILSGALTAVPPVRHISFPHSAILNLKKTSPPTGGSESTFQTFFLSSLQKKIHPSSWSSEIMMQSFSSFLQ